MFTLIEEYMLLEQKERQKHLQLNENCIEIGGKSDQCKALLAHFLKTTIPKGRYIHLCHACENAKCSNPHHLYWGTQKENRQDALRSGKNPGRYFCNNCDKYHKSKNCPNV